MLLTVFLHSTGCRNVKAVGTEQTILRMRRLQALGEELFFDSLLSRDHQISCASCHSPTHGFAEPFQVSLGHGVMSRRRNTPSLADLSVRTSFGWTGSRSSLADQLLDVFSPDGDMGIDLDVAVARLSQTKRYRREFVALFGKPPEAATVVASIVAFESSILSGEIKLDRFLKGDTESLSVQERTGFGVFEVEGCAGCHKIRGARLDSVISAPLSDERFHNLGIGFSVVGYSDLGRAEHSSELDDWGSFKTPSLRIVASTPPYMHDGSVATLRDVIALYARGGVNNRNLDPIVRATSLSTDQQLALLHFLCTLSSRSFPTRDQSCLELKHRP